MDAVVRSTGTRLDRLSVAAFGAQLLVTKSFLHPLVAVAPLTIVGLCLHGP